MSEHYAVRVSNDSLVFSAAHFITFGGGVCEELHGHDFRVAAEVRGPLDENRYVVDFVALQDAVETILAELDHRVLLPTEHLRIRVTADEREVEARFEDRRWVFPRGDCALLPIANTTSELLARHIGIRLRGELRAACDIRPDIVRVEVAESSGQSAVCVLTAD
jgi:6-pyruvoyltetrahydropterin/6-carboxytetrahydropterin synthase